jgi:hypothetical protein
MSDFEHDASFEQAADAAGLDLDRYEACYQQLFSEALADGVITAEERERLERAAETMGLDVTRLGALENALENAYTVHHGVKPLHTVGMFKALESIMPATAVDVDVDLTTAEPPAPAEGVPDELSMLRTRVRFLEERVKELEVELEETRAHVAVEVDFSDLDAPIASSQLEEPAALHRRLRHDPRDVATLHALVQAHAGDADRQWCAAQALVYLGEANEFERDLYAQHKSDTLISPKAAIDATAWKRLLHHPDDEALTSDILSVLASAVLLAHSSALKAKGQLPELPPERRVDLEATTLAAARCFGWAAQTLGTAVPPIFTSPDSDSVAQMWPSVPPGVLLGKRALSGRTPVQLAFLAGHHLAYYRRERFIRKVVPSIMDLEDLFLAALLIGNKALPINAEVRQRVAPITGAIEPLLEAGEIDKLRAAYKRFVEHGGRTNLQRWAQAADMTAVRAGFALCGDLTVAEEMLEVSGSTQVNALMDDLLVFATGDRYSKLRAHMGIGVRG